MFVVAGHSRHQLLGIFRLDICKEPLGSQPAQSCRGATVVFDDDITALTLFVGKPVGSAHSLSALDRQPDCICGGCWFPEVRCQRLGCGSFVILTVGCPGVMSLAQDDGESNARGGEVLTGVLKRHSSDYSVF